VDAKVLSDPKYKYIFRVSLNTKYLVEYLIEAMKLVRSQSGFDKVFIMNQDVAWARSTASLMIKLYFDRYGWKVLGQENLPEGKPDFRPLLRRVRDQGGQVILAIFDMPGSDGLIRQWHDQKSPAMLCGFISPASGPDAWNAFGGRLAGVMNVIFELGNLPADAYSPSVTFYRAFRNHYGRPIQAGHGPAPAYDSVYILARALERAGSLDPDRVAAALEATDYQGAMGRVRFHRGHQTVFGVDPGENALGAVVQWAPPGTRRIVFPASIADGAINPGGTP
jgi:branched-chain amino acid transport system substrate-binding protein